MAIYRPDHKLREAKEYVEKLDNSKESDLIRYLIEKKDEQIERQNEKLKEYADFFDKLDKFLPNRNPVLG